MANLKAASSDRFVQLVFGLPVNQRVEFALRDAIEESAHFGFLSRNLEFHAAIRQVMDPPVYVEAFGHVAYRPAKSNPLNVALVKYLKGSHDLPQNTENTGYLILDARWQGPRTRKSYPTSRIAHRLFVRIDETETASIAFNQIDRNKVLAAVRR